MLHNIKCIQNSRRRTPPFKRCTMAIPIQQYLCHVLATTRTIEALAGRRASPTNNSHRTFPGMEASPTPKTKVTLGPSGDKQKLQNYTLTVLLDPTAALVQSHKVFLVERGATKHRNMDCRAPVPNLRTSQFAHVIFFCVYIRYRKLLYRGTLLRIVDDVRTRLRRQAQ